MGIPSHPPLLATQFYAACIVLKFALFSFFFFYFFISLLEHNLEFTEVHGKIWLRRGLFSARLFVKTPGSLPLCTRLTHGPCILTVPSSMPTPCRALLQGCT